MVLGLSLYSSKSLWWSLVYPLSHHFLFCGTQSIPIQSLITVYILAQTILILITLYLLAQTNPILITVSLVVPRLSLYSSQSAWWYSGYPYTHHSLPGGTQSIHLLITISLVDVRLSLYSSQFPSWYLDYPFTHQVCLVVLKLSLYTSQSSWWYSEYPYTPHSLSGSPQTHILTTIYLVSQTISMLITDSLGVLRLSLYSSKSLWWSSDYPYTHHNLLGVSDNLYTNHSLPGGTQTIPLLITVSIVVLRLSLYSSKSLWWYSDYPYTPHSESSCWSAVYPYPHHFLFGGTQTNPIRIIVSLVVLKLSPYSPQST